MHYNNITDLVTKMLKIEGRSFRQILDTLNIRYLYIDFLDTLNTKYLGVYKPLHPLICI